MGINILALRATSFRSLIGLLTVIGLSLSSCKTSVEKINDADDVEAGKELATGFYMHILNGNLEEAAKLFSSHLGYDEGVKALQKFRSLYGQMLSVDEMEVYTNTKVQGEKKTGEYVITSKVVYEKEVCKEIVTVTFINSKPFITGYKTNIIID